MLNNSGVVDGDNVYNALDSRDFVALHPLTRPYVSISPEIENNVGVDNSTPNHHGIIGYLGDKNVARKIYDDLAGLP